MAPAAMASATGLLSCFIVLSRYELVISVAAYQRVRWALEQRLAGCSVWVVVVLRVQMLHQLSVLYQAPKLDLLLVLGLVLGRVSFLS